VISLAHYSCAPTDRLPPLDRWGPQFERMVNGSYVLRGVEVTLQGTVEVRGGQLFLAAGRTTPLVRLVPADPADKVQWDRATGAPKPLEPAESEAYGMLAADARTFPPGQRLTVTGPLKQSADGYQLEVRLFTV
jgi:galactose oxidase